MTGIYPHWCYVSSCGHTINKDLCQSLEVNFTGNRNTSIPLGKTLLFCPMLASVFVSPGHNESNPTFTPDNSVTWIHLFEIPWELYFSNNPQYPQSPNSPQYNSTSEDARLRVGSNERARNYRITVIGFKFFFKKGDDQIPPTDSIFFDFYGTINWNRADVPKFISEDAMKSSADRVNNNGMECILK